MRAILICQCHSRISVLCCTFKRIYCLSSSCDYDLHSFMRLEQLSMHLLLDQSPYQ